jgi:hypothetical protein
MSVKFVDNAEEIAEGISEVDDEENICTKERRRERRVKKNTEYRASWLVLIAYHNHREWFNKDEVGRACSTSRGRQ